MSKLREYLLFLMIIRSETLSDIASSAKNSLRQPTLVVALLDFGQDNALDFKNPSVNPPLVAK